MMEAARDAKPWRRLKVVFLGNGRSGKLSLQLALARLELDGDERSTCGVTVDSFADKLQPNVFDRLFAGVDLSFWDFAGQLEYSASHTGYLPAGSHHDCLHQDRPALRLVCEESYGGSAR